jgi:hypothetical protein
MKIGVHARRIIPHAMKIVVRARRIIPRAMKIVVHARRIIPHAMKIGVHAKRIVSVAMAFVRTATANAPVRIEAIPVATRADRIAIAFVPVAVGSFADDTSVVLLAPSRIHRRPRSICGAMPRPAHRRWIDPGRKAPADRPTGIAASPMGSNASAKGLAFGREGSPFERGGTVAIAARDVPLTTARKNTGTAGRREPQLARRAPFCRGAWYGTSRSRVTPPRAARRSARTWRGAAARW